MAKLFNVQLKIGGRSHNIELYASSFENIIEFVNLNLVAKVVKVQEIVYDVRETLTIPVDDKSIYQGTAYMLVRNDNANLTRRFVLPTLRLNRSDIDLVNSMKEFLHFGSSLKIDSVVSTSIR